MADFVWTYTCRFRTFMLAVGFCGDAKEERATRPATTAAIVVKKPNTFCSRTREECIVCAPTTLSWVSCWWTGEIRLSEVAVRKPAKPCRTCRRDVASARPSLHHLSLLPRSPLQQYIKPIQKSRSEAYRVMDIGGRSEFLQMLI